MHVIAAKAIALREALDPSFAIYTKRVVKNAKMLSKTLIERGVDIVSDGTDTHLILVDLRPKQLTGKEAESALETVGITCNKNSIPFDPEKPIITSGIRLGTPAGTTRGFGEAEFKLIGNLIGDVLDGIGSGYKPYENTQASVAITVKKLCQQFPIYAMIG